MISRNLCKSLYSTVLVPSMHSDSNPVSRRFCSIDSICLTFLSLLLSPSTTNQPTNQPLAITKTCHPPFLPKKNTRSKGRKERKKKRRIKLVSYIYIHIYINPRKETDWAQKKDRRQKRKKRTSLSDDLTYGREEVFSFLFSKKANGVPDWSFVYSYWMGTETERMERNETKNCSQSVFRRDVGRKKCFLFSFSFFEKRIG